MQSLWNSPHYNNKTSTAASGTGRPVNSPYLGCKQNGPEFRHSRLLYPKESDRQQLPNGCRIRMLQYTSAIQEIDKVDSTKDKGNTI